MRRSGDLTDPKFWETELTAGPAKNTDIEEIRDDRLAQEAAVATIKADPQTFVLSCLYRAGWLWAPYPADLDDSSEPIKSSDPATSSAPAKPNEANANSIHHALLQTLKKTSVKQLVIGIWYGCWFVMAVAGVFWLREALTSRVWLMPILLVLSLTAIHMIYWSNMRMRAPMMPVVYMLACWPLMTTRTPSRL